MVKDRKDKHRLPMEMRARKGVPEADPRHIRAYLKFTGIFSCRGAIIFYYCPNLADTHE
jgi:hypothetical protein